MRSARPIATYGRGVWRCWHCLAVLHAMTHAPWCPTSTLTPVNRLQFAPNSSCLWALAEMPAAPGVPGAAEGGAAASGLLCFAVPDGGLLQRLDAPHGAAVCTSFALSPGGGVLATCGADHLLKLWDVSRGGGDAAAAVVLAPPIPQAYAAHYGAVTGVRAVRRLVWEFMHVLCLACMQACLQPAAKNSSPCQHACMPCTPHLRRHLLRPAARVSGHRWQRLCVAPRNQRRAA
jgi:hypothetical protein